MQIGHVSFAAFYSLRKKVVIDLFLGEYMYIHLFNLCHFVLRISIFFFWIINSIAIFSQSTGPKGLCGQSTREKSYETTVAFLTMIFRTGVIKTSSEQDFIAVITPFYKASRGYTFFCLIYDIMLGRISPIHVQRMH